MNDLTKAFPSSPVLNWLPGETLYSLVSRNHFLWGHGQPWRVRELLFGDSYTGWQHDFPAGIREFSVRTDGVLGSAETITRERTLLKYYAPFVSSIRVAAAAEAMSGNSVAHLKFRLGLLTSRFRAHHPLKACTHCIADDTRDFGWSYWHLEHQYPGVWWCDRHSRQLQESLVKSTGVGRFQWFLPSAENLRPVTEMARSDSRALEKRLASLARMITDLIRPATAGVFSDVLVLAAFRTELSRRGWLSSSGRLKLKNIAQSYLDHAVPLRALSEFKATPQNYDDAHAQIGRLLRPLRGGTHPLRYLLIADWLFDDAMGFLADLQGVSVASVQNEEEFAPDDSTEVVLPEKDPAGPNEPNLATLLLDGKSVRAAATEVGITTATALIRASQLGVQILRRPKILKSEKRAALVADLQSGKDKAVAARTHGVSVATVTRVLLEDVGLHDKWESVRYEAAKNSSREEWSGLLASYGRLGVKLIRAMKPAVYAWLYRNDRDWLKGHMPPAQERPVSSSGSRVEWVERDVALKAEVEAVVLALFSSGNRKIHLWQIYQQVPELKAKLSVLDRMPLTKRAIEVALARHASSVSSSKGELL